MLTPHCSAASGIVVPPSIVSTTRLRKSAEYGFAIHAGLLPAGSLNHIRAAMGIPDSAFPGNALSTDRSLLSFIGASFYSDVSSDGRAAVGTLGERVHPSMSKMARCLRTVFRRVSLVLGSGMPTALEEEPGSLLGFVNPVLQQACRGHVSRLVT